MHSPSAEFRRRPRGTVSRDSSYPQLFNTILAYNDGNNLTGSTDQVTISSALIYNPPTMTQLNLPQSSSLLTVEPQFLAYADSSSGAACVPGSTSTCVPFDLHPALGSPLINAGDPSTSDVDGSRSDLGIYGGADGDLWDVDSDGVPDYFWPAEWHMAPAGFDPLDFDCDDANPSVQDCF